MFIAHVFYGTKPYEFYFGRKTDCYFTPEKNRNQIELYKGYYDSFKTDQLVVKI